MPTSLELATAARVATSLLGEELESLARTQPKKNAAMGRALKRNEALWGHINALANRVEELEARLASPAHFVASILEDVPADRPAPAADSPPPTARRSLPAAPRPPRSALRPADTRVSAAPATAPRLRRDRSRSAVNPLAGDITGKKTPYRPKASRETRQSWSKAFSDGKGTPMWQKVVNAWGKALPLEGEITVADIHKITAFNDMTSLALDLAIYRAPCKLTHIEVNRWRISPR